MAPQTGNGPAVIEVIGSLNMDLLTVTTRVPGPGETIRASSFSTGFGGKGANQAVAAARLLRQSSDAKPEPGITVGMTGAVGDDQFGKDFLVHLCDEKIDVRGVRVKQGYKTGTSCILVEEESGENRILFTEGANGELTPADASNLGANKDGERHYVVLQMEIPLDTLLACMKEAKRLGKEVVFNPAPAMPLPDEVYVGLDHLIMNESEASILSGLLECEITASPSGAAQVFLNKGVRNVVITLGSAGAYFLSKSSNGSSSGQTISGQKVKAIDTTAAGDTWVGAYVLHLARTGNDDIASAAAFGNKAAARAVTKAGAQASMPFAGEV